MVFKPILSLVLVVSTSIPCFAKTQLSPWVFRGPAAFREPAAINRAAIAMAAPSNLLYGHDGQEISPELLVVFHQWKAEQKPFNTADVVPLDMSPSADSQAVFSRIADRSLAYYFNRADFRASPLGRTATQVEENVKQEVVLKNSDGVQHKLNFSVEAFQATAKIQYTGFMNMAVRYQAAESTVGVEVSEELAPDTDVVLGHKDKRAERVSEVALHFSF